MKLKVIILFKLCGSRNLSEFSALCTLGLNEVLNEFFGEYSAFGKILIILFQAIKSFIKRYGKSLKL